MAFPLGPSERQATSDRRDGIDMLPASSQSVSAQLLFFLCLSICRLSSREGGVEMEAGKQSRNPVKSNMLHNKDISPKMIEYFPLFFWI